MGAGKFFPGKSRRDKSQEEPRQEPIRAEPPEKKAGSGGLFPQARARFSKKVDTRQKPVVMLIGIIFCIVFISIGWYYGAVRPARARAAALAAEVERQKLELEELKKKQAETKKEVEVQQAAARSTLQVNTKPSGAQVTLQGNKKTTPAAYEELIPGKATLILEREGYHTITREITLEGNQNLDLGVIELVRKVGSVKITSALPQVSYTLTGADNFSQSGDLPAVFEKVPEGEYTLAVTHKGWQLPVEKLTVRDGKETTFEAKFGYGTVTLGSTPPGAAVRRGKLDMGKTPVTLSELRPGSYAYTVELEGYRLATTKVEVKEFGNYPIDLTLEKTKDFKNGIGLALVWLEKGYWVGRHEVTQAQFEQVFGAGTNPSLFRGPNRPVDSVSWEEANAFCVKLTQKELAAGKLPEGYKYALPTEAQWNEYVDDANPENAILAYNLSNAPTSSMDVGSSDPNRLGLYDVLGNVWEWCRDNFDATGRAKVMRGGGWLSTRETFPNKATRNGGGANYKDKLTGFRVVLVKAAP